jgi:hypothetical protein
MRNALWIFVVGGLGSLARRGASGYSANYFAQTFLSGTLVVNVTGSCTIGLFATATGREGRWMAPALSNGVMAQASRIVEWLHRRSSGVPLVLCELLAEMASGHYDVNRAFDLKLLDLDRRIRQTIGASTQGRH